MPGSSASGKQTGTSITGFARVAFTGPRATRSVLTPAARIGTFVTGAGTDRRTRTASRARGPRATRSILTPAARIGPFVAGARPDRRASTSPRARRTRASVRILITIELGTRTTPGRGASDARGAITIWTRSPGRPRFGIPGVGATNAPLRTIPRWQTLGTTARIGASLRTTTRIARTRVSYNAAATTTSGWAARARRATGYRFGIRHRSILLTKVPARERRGAQRARAA